MRVPVGAPAALSLRLFGPFDARLQGAPLARRRSRKGEWLLALLVLRHGRPVDRAWLAGMLWPETAPSPALALMRRELTDLRRALGSEAGRLHAPTAHTLCLDLAGADVDLVAFDQAVAQGDPPALEQAVALYRGPLLEGCEEEWAFQERQAREERYLDGLERLAAQANEKGDAARAERYLRSAVGADPLRESAQRRLMQLLAAGGNYAAVLQVYQELRGLLHRQMNTEPDAETTALFQQLRAEAREKSVRGGAPPRSGAPCPVRAEQASARRTASEPLIAVAATASDATLGNLLLQLTSFIGREDEIAAIQQMLGAHRLVTLTGPGGCGKTRLALQVATDLRVGGVAATTGPDGSGAGPFPDGVWFVDLAPLADPALVPQSVAAALGVREAPGASVTQALVGSLKARQLLLVLDNCEHLLTACARLVETLLQACPRLWVLATSREALEIGGENPYAVPSLSLPDERAAVTLEGLTQYEAIRLFIERAATVQPGFRVTEASASAVAAICRELDGMPLAIELAAGRLKALPVEEISARLEDRFRLLARGKRTALPRHQTLRACIDWSFDLLSEPEQRLLLRLSVFAGGWTLEAAEAVTCGEARVPAQRVDGCVREEVEAWGVLDLLTSLVEKSLVLYEERGGEQRYRLLETVRQYARDRLLEGGEAEAVWARHRDFFLALAEAAAPELWGREQVAWLKRLETEHDNFRLALEWSGKHDPEGELRLAGALWWFWHVRGYLGEGRERLGAALRGAERHVELRRSEARARALVGVGLLAQVQGDYAEARPPLEESLTIFREGGDKQDITFCLNQLGFTVYEQGDYPLARSLLEESLAILREGGSQRFIADCLDFLGLAAYEQGDHAEARSLFEESLTVSRDGGNKWGIAARLGHLGRAAYVRGDHSAARSLHEECLTIWRELGYKRGIAQSLESFARLAARGREWERAARLLGAAAALRDAIGAPPAPHRREEGERELDAARAALGEESFAASWAEGRAMPLEQAVAYALEEEG